MYVGPWQEYKLMRVINEVKAENEKLKSLMQSSSRASVASTTSTPRSLQSIPGLPKRPAASASRRETLRRPRPLDEALLAAATPTSSDRSACSAPAELPHFSGSTGHAILQELVRGPPTVSEREANAGQPGLKKKPAALSLEELEERKQRRASMSMLYASEIPPPPLPVEPRTRAGKPQIHPSRRPPSGGSTNFSAAVKRNEGLQQQQDAGHVSRSDAPTMINRNVVRDLASFYDQHTHNMQQQQQQQRQQQRQVPLPPPSLTQARFQQQSAYVPPTHVPWESMPFDLPPTQLLSSSVAALPLSHDRYASNGSPLRAHHPRGSLPADNEPIHRKTSGPMGAGDAQKQAMQRRPYDVGPTPSAEPHYAALYSSTQPNPWSSLLPSASREAIKAAGAFGTSGSTTGSTLDDFVLGPHDDQLHQRAADVLRSSVEKKSTAQIAYSATASPKSRAAAVSDRHSQDVVDTAAWAMQKVDAASKYIPPPPPQLPKDFMMPFTTLSGDQESRLAPHDTPKKPASRQSALSAVESHNPPRAQSVATDLSIDGEDVGALLHWASSLDTRDIWGRTPQHVP